MYGSGLVARYLWPAFAAVGCLGLAASAIVAVILTMPNDTVAASRVATSDVTYSCAVTLGRRPHYIDVVANAKTPKGEPAFALVYTALTPSGKTFVPQIMFNSSTKALAGDSKLCHRSKSIVPLRSTGLSPGGTVTVHFGGILNQRCVTSARALIRVQIHRNGAGLPSRAELAVASASPKTAPVAFVNWTPTRVTYSLAKQCVDRGQVIGP
jgi:hypothetical protein